MNKISTLVLAAACAVGAQAAPFAFDFGSSGGTTSGSGYTIQRTYTIGSLTVTVTAWGITGDAASGGTDNAFQQAQLGQFSPYGFGTCDQDEGLGCSSPEHRVDNNQRADFVLFSFSQAVTLDQLYLRNLYNDGDATYYSGNLTGSLAGLRLDQIGTVGLTNRQNNDTTSTADRNFALSTTGPVNALLVGARVGGSGADYNTDYFKIYSVTGSTGVPEPTTVSMIGAALVGLGLVRRRKS